MLEGRLDAPVDHIEPVVLADANLGHPSIADCRAFQPPRRQPIVLDPLRLIRAKAR